MVLQELGSRITQALASIGDAAVVDDAVLDACLKEIAGALLKVSCIWLGLVMMDTLQPCLPFAGRC